MPSLIILHLPTACPAAILGEPVSEAGFPPGSSAHFPVKQIPAPGQLEKRDLHAVTGFGQDLRANVKTKRGKRELHFQGMSGGGQDQGNGGSVGN